MRWEILQKVWKLAKAKFPNVERLYVDLPIRFRSDGECAVYDLDKAGEPVGVIAYSNVVEDGVPLVSVRLEGQTEKVAAGRVSRECRVGIALDERTKAPRVDVSLLRRGCRDGFDVGRKLALLFSNGARDGRASVADVRRWASGQGVDMRMVVPIMCGLEDMGFELEGNGGAYNLRLASGKQKFEPHQRVRVIHPTAMDYQECGRVMECKGGPKDGFWYAVLVDGSQDPLWFPEEALDEDEAGDVADPELEPIDG